MKSRKGSILVMTVGFMLVFTLIGFATMSYSGFQGQGIAMKTSSTQGFWLAEAGVQRALSWLPGGLYNPSVPIALGEGNYTVTTQLKPGYNHRWVITSTGMVTPVTKIIQAESAPNVIKAFQTTGTLKDRSEQQISPSGSYTEGRENFTYTFSGLFGTLNASSAGVQVMNNPNNNQDVDRNGNPLVDGIIWVNGDFKITSSWAHKGVLIVNGSFEMTGGSFEGIVWVEGAAKMIEGNPGVTGAVFVNDPSDGQTKIDSSSAHITYNAQTIDQVFDLLSTAPPETYRHIVLWKEKQ